MLTNPEFNIRNMLSNCKENQNKVKAVFTLFQFPRKLGNVKRMFGFVLQVSNSATFVEKSFKVWQERMNSAGEEKKACCCFRISLVFT